MADLPKTEDDRTESQSQVTKAPEVPRVSFALDDETESYEINIGDNSTKDAELLKSALGIKRPGMLVGLLSQVLNATKSHAGPVELNHQYALAFIQSIEPENEIETALATQMAATHIAAIESSRRYMEATSLQQRDSAERAMNKLMRTFTTQMDALKRYRSKAQQVVRVERVTVEDGGQAIVGPVSHGGGSES